MGTVSFVLWIVAILLTILFGLRRSRKIDLTRSQVADIIQTFIDGSGDEDNWNRFINVQMKNRQLEEIRRRCVTLKQQFSPTAESKRVGPEGYKLMRQIAIDLRQTIFADRRRAAQLARDYYAKRMNYTECLQQFPECDDDDVNSLLDLIEHEPRPDNSRYMQHIEETNKLITRLEMSPLASQPNGV